MSDCVDLRPLLDGWPYDPENDARIVRGADGRELLQVRTTLGVEQYEMTGRPDGLRPHGKETALEHYMERLKEAQAQGRTLELGARECGELFHEGTLFYFRYVRLFQLKDWPRTLRDTSRNLRLFDFVRDHARREEDRGFLEKWRPYIVRVNGSAGAMLALSENAFEKALKISQKTIETLENLEEIEDETFRFERERALTGMRELSMQIQKNRPLTQLELLERQLRRAVDHQEFERAAELRDKIRALRNQET